MSQFTNSDLNNLKYIAYISKLVSTQSMFMLLDKN